MKISPYMTGFKKGLNMVFATASMILNIFSDVKDF